MSNGHFSSLLSQPPDHTILHHFPFSLLPNPQHKHNQVQKHSYNPSENLLLKFRQPVQGPTPTKLRSPITFSGETQMLPLHLFTCSKLLGFALIFFSMFLHFFTVNAWLRIMSQYSYSCIFFALCLLSTLAVNACLLLNTPCVYSLCLCLFFCFYFFILEVSLSCSFVRTMVL